jgi:hypothetical protein
MNAEALAMRNAIASEFAPNTPLNGSRPSAELVADTTDVQLARLAL